MGTTGTYIDEVECLYEEVKQAIRQKVARQATLQNIIVSDQTLAKARYLGDNERGAMLSMRRIHRLKFQQAKVAKSCADLMQMRVQLEIAMMAENKEEAYANLDLSDLHDTLEQAVDMVEDADHVMPTAQALHKLMLELNGMLEI